VTVAAASDGETPTAAARAEIGTAAILLSFAESLAAVGGVDEVCATIVDQCRTQLGASGSGVSLYDPAEQMLRMVNLQGYPP